jgi:S1-C subfamily serine protease
VEEIRYSWHRGELRAKYEASGDGLKNVSLGALSEAYQMVTQHVGPSVVHIEVIRQADESQAHVAKLLGTNFSDDFSPLSDQGSGVVIDGDGYVMTNYHVIADGSQIQVGLSDGRRVPATVVGTDPLTDLALLKISADRLIPIRWGDSDLCEVGSPVWAVGSPFGLDRTVTFGILSGKHRVVKASTRYQDFMQSDAAVNPGNSGGPLVDANGELVGINTAIVGDTFRGVSFSIPSNVVKSVYERLRATGRVDRGWLGVALDEVPDEMVVGDDYRVRGAIITGLAGGDSPAARGGAQAGDIIIRLNDQPIEDVGHMMRVTGNLAAGTRIKLDVVRGEGQVVLELVVGARPESLSMR